VKFDIGCTTTCFVNTCVHARFFKVKVELNFVVLFFYYSYGE